MGEPSPRTFQVATEKGGKRLMSEDEVSSLVHSALLRARQATSSFSPRARSARSPLSHTSSITSPTMGRSPVHSSSGSRPPPSNSPRKSSLYLPRDDEIQTRPSLSKRSQRTMYGTPRSRAGEESSAFSFEEFHTPTYRNHMESVELDFNGVAIASNDDDDDALDHESDLGPATISSVNSSELIIRRVEEEIANARKAAQEANRRLAGVSANLKDARSGSTDDEAANHDSAPADEQAAAAQDAGESRNPANNSNEEENGSFDSAIDIIGEEFDVVEESELFDEPAPKASDEAESTGTSTAIGLNPLDEEVPEDERCLEPIDTDHSAKEKDIDVPMSPSEEIDNLLRDTSNEETEDSSAIQRRRTIDVISEDVLEAPSEEIKTPITRSRSAETTEEVEAHKVEVDETEYLATASIDDEAVGEKEVRGSKDSQFQEAAKDNDLLEWLPIGASDQDETKENTSEVIDEESAAPVDELTASNDEQPESEESEGPDDEVPSDETEAIEKEKDVASLVVAEEDDAPADEEETSKEDDEAAPVDRTTEESPSMDFEAPTEKEETIDYPVDDAPLDEQSPQEEQGQDTNPVDEEAEDAVEDMKVENIYSDADSLPDAMSRSNKEGEIAVAENPNDEGAERVTSDESSTNDNADVFIYQVVSATSGDAIAGEAVLSADETNADLDEEAANDEEAPMDEAIEVATEPIQSVEDAEEQVNRMNASRSSESETAQETENEEADNNDQEMSEPEPFYAKCDSYESAVQTPEVSVDSRDRFEDPTDEIQHFRDLASVNPVEIQGENAGYDDDQVNPEEIHGETAGYDDDDQVNPEEPQGESTGYDDDDQVTQIMGNTGGETPRDQQLCQLMSNINETEMENPDDDESNSKENVPETPETMSPITATRSPVQVETTPVDSPRHVAAQEPVSKMDATPVPNPRRVALVENRRAAQSKVDEARNAMIGDTDLPTGLPNPKKDIVHRVMKVKFKNRYPVPPPQPRPLQPAEIVFRNQTPAPKDQLYFSKPKKDLKELLEAAIGDSIHRRSNAFGALKVLSTQKKNKVALVKTNGFLDATVFAINDDVSSYEDFEAAVASRTRAVSVILNVSEMKDNRYHVFNHPGLADSLVKCMIEDRADARAFACSVLATLAKSATCREPISSTPKLLDTLAIILKGREPSSFTGSRQPHMEEEKKDYSGDDEASRNVFSGSYSSGSSGDHSSVGSEFAEARNRARLSACAALLHLSKECSVAQKMCQSSMVLFCLVGTCNETDNPLHTKCLEILTNLTRFSYNNAIMTRYPGLVDTLIMNGNHKLDIDRLWSMRALQNLSSDSSSKTILGTGTVLELLSVNIMRQKYGEQYAATATLYNISTEPGAVVPLTNTKNVVATLVHVAHNPTSPSDVRLMACDTLATLGLWLQTLAGAGIVPPEVDPVPLPTYVTSGWKRWEK